MMFLAIMPISATALTAADDSITADEASTEHPMPTYPPSGDQPSITILADFPDEAWHPAISFQYAAYPSENNVEERVTYHDGEEFTVGGVDFGFLLDIGFVFEENNIVYTLRDSDGKEAIYTILNIVNNKARILSEQRVVTMAEMSDGREYITNHLIIHAHDGTTFDQLEEAISTIDGVILDYDARTRIYIIEVPHNTDEELLELAAQLKAAYPNLIDRCKLSIINGRIGFATLKGDSPGFTTALEEGINEMEPIQEVHWQIQGGAIRNGFLLLLGFLMFAAIILLKFS